MPVLDVRRHFPIPDLAAAFVAAAFVVRSSTLRCEEGAAPERAGEAHG